ncbi:betaine/proline/choline family ABC transporter ATP-binding protein [Paenibacillus sp. NPDC058071]|uniref:betaine/proline/choline family ABC transporter ATP-binding protein n=1 Tax=Paenibacillus sp. NPDC058071 TaxID=3346326 RepID=UPI0036D92785
MSRFALEFKQVSKDYGAGPVLENFNLTIEKERLVTLIGPSGCGKTTLLKMINRLIEPDQGQILWEGNEISKLDPVELRRSIGYVIQQIGLFPHMTIEENISIVPRLKGESKQKLVSRTEELLELIGLDPAKFRKRYPHELSGGQQQRIGVARALAANPSVILMDEPFSALDPISRVQLQKELIHLNRHVKKTIVFVTHDIDEALKIADDLILLKNGQIVQAGSPEELLKHPADAFVREFLGSERFAPEVSPQPHSAPSLIHLMEASGSIDSHRYVSEALQQLHASQASELLVTDANNKVVGIVGRDELGQRPGLSESGRLKVAEVMRPPGPSVQDHSPIAKLLDLLQEYPIVPVVDDNERLLGTITRQSCIKAFEQLNERKETAV